MTALLWIVGAIVALLLLVMIALAAGRSHGRGSEAQDRSRAHGSPMAFACAQGRAVSPLSGCRLIGIPVDMHMVTNRDLERIVRVKRAWWRLYVVELARLMPGREK